MGGAGSACRYLPAVRRRGSRLEVAEHYGGSVARLLGQSFVVAADRARTRRRGGAKCAVRRAQELALLPAKLFACVANGSGWCLRSGANDFRRLDLLSPSGSHRGQRQFALAEQRPERSGKRGNGV